MSSYRFFLFALIALIAGTSLIAFSQAPAIEPIKDSGQSVTGAFEGWYQNPDGTYNLLLGYMNRNGKETLDIPVGPNNRIEPGGPDQGQPTYFMTRRQWGVFTITVPKDFGNKKLTWTIVANGQSTSIPLNLNPLWVVEPLKDDATGNTPPVLRFEPNGTPFTGPPRGFAKTMTAKVSEPLVLDLWATDDGRIPPERGGAASPTPAAATARGAATRGAAAAAARGIVAARATAGRATLSWSKFRGPGEVTFDPPRPMSDAEGKATTSAKFSAPGEYILRIQANDATGDGGGGFQCCWTNAHIKVTVN
jgi:hypothetical protein